MKSSIRIVLAVAFGLWVLAAGPTAAEEWVSIGPFGTSLVNNDVISGQVNAIAVHPKDANTLYVGASEGGVWKTSNGGATWTVLTDTQLVRKQPSGIPKGTLTIGSIAIDPKTPQTVYVGTGEPNLGCCASLVGAALGVFRTTDGGTTWGPMGANLSQAGCSNGTIGAAVVNRLLVVSGAPTTVFAATNTGLFKYLEDGNDCWTRLSLGLPISGNAIDLVEDPFQGALYVAFGSRGIFKSTDLSGAQWRMLAGGLPASGFGRIALAFGGRTGVGFNNPLPLVYAGFDANGTYRLFKTVNGGDAWSELPVPPSDGQLDFNNVVAVGTYDSDEVYIAQINLWRATDGGRHGSANSYKVTPPVTSNSWTNLSCCLADPNPNPFRKNVDLHADFHAVVFAPSGSFVPSPSQVQIVYAVNDGGVIKGSVDFQGAISWQSLTKGMAIGQAGTIGLDPGSETTTVAGYWHNGDILTFTDLAQSVPVGGGDGFQTTIDAGNLIVYFNCNAGFGGAICRALPPAPFFTNFKVEKIWSDNEARKQWSDPHRPGHLLRLQKVGLLFRTEMAATAAASVLDTADAWVAVDPFWGKTGATTTMAFRSRVLEEQPIYYLGTDTGQVWRGSPEAGWTKLCECGSPVNQISPDLFQNERIFVALKGTASPGRIKELNRLANGTWTTTNIDTAFTPDVEVRDIESVAVDPAETHGTTVYVGTDQGMFRGHFEPIVVEPRVLEPRRAALIGLPPPLGGWTWRRSPGVPLIMVTDLEVQQNFQNHDRSGILRAGTWGRGLFELRRTSLVHPVETRFPILGVQAVEIGDDGAPTPLNVMIPLAGPSLSQDKKLAQETPFEIAAPKGAGVVLEAPLEIRQKDEFLKFVGWVVPGKRPEGSNRISLTVAEASKAVAYYEIEQQIADPKAKPPHVSLTTSVRQVCLPGFSHELILTWDVSDGKPPVEPRVDITGPDQHLESVELKTIEGTRTFPMNFPKGGAVKVRISAEDANQASSTADSGVELKACAGGSKGVP